MLYTPVFATGSSSVIGLQVINIEPPTLVAVVIDRYRVRVSGTAPMLSVVHLEMTGNEDSGNTVVLSQMVTVSDDGSWKFTTGFLNAGTYSFTAYVETLPLPGNRGKSTEPVIVRINLFVPDDVIATVIDNAKVEVTGVSYPFGKARIRIFGDNKYRSVVDVDTDENGHFSYTSSALLVGFYRVSVATVDTSGEVGPWSDKETFSIFSEVFKNAFALFVKFVDEHPMAANIVSTIGALILFFAFLFNREALYVATQLSQELWARALAFLAGLLGGIQKKRQWGLVYDASSGKPIPFAVVRLYEIGSRFVEMRVTDALGSYYFFVRPGTYTLEVEKPGYVRASDEGEDNEKVRYADTYYAGEIVVSDPDVLHKDIPLRALSGSATAGKQHATLRHVQASLFGTVFLIGFCVNFLIMVRHFSVLNVLLLGVYVLIWMVNSTMNRKIRHGRVVDASDKSFAFATVDVINQATGDQEARTLSDENGRYFLIVNKGLYTVKITGLDGQLKLVKEVRIFERKSLTEKFVCG